MREFLRDYQNKSIVLNNQKKDVSILLLSVLGITIIWSIVICLLWTYTIYCNFILIGIYIVFIVIYLLRVILAGFPKKARIKYLFRPYKLLKCWGYKTYRNERRIVSDILKRRNLNKNVEQINTIIEYLEKKRLEEKKHISPAEIYNFILSMISICISIVSILKLENVSNETIIASILLLSIIIVIGFYFVKQFKTDLKFIYDSVIEKQIDYQLLLDIMYDLRLEYYKNKH